MHTVYRRLPDDEIMWRSKKVRYIGYGIVALLAVFAVATFSLLIIYSERTERIALASFVVGGLTGIAIGRSSR